MKNPKGIQTRKDPYLVHRGGGVNNQTKTTWCAKEHYGEQTKAFMWLPDQKKNTQKPHCFCSFIFEFNMENVLQPCVSNMQVHKYVFENLTIIGLPPPIERRVLEECRRFSFQNGHCFKSQQNDITFLVEIETN